MLSKILAALLACCATSVALAAGAHPDFAGIPNVTFEFYDVRGATASGIRWAINRDRPRDDNGVGYDAVTNWTMRWKWTGERRDDGGCGVRDAAVIFAATVRLPRLLGADALPASVSVRWQNFIDAVEQHEAGHARHAYDHAVDVKAAILASACDKADAAASAAIATIRKQQADYDRTTRHGETQGAVFP